MAAVSLQGVMLEQALPQILTIASSFRNQTRSFIFEPIWHVFTGTNQEALAVLLGALKRRDFSDLNVVSKARQHKYV